MQYSWNYWPSQRLRIRLLKKGFPLSLFRFFSPFYAVAKSRTNLHSQCMHTVWDCFIFCCFVLVLPRQYCCYKILHRSLVDSVALVTVFNCRLKPNSNLKEKNPSDIYLLTEEAIFTAPRNTVLLSSIIMYIAWLVTLHCKTFGESILQWRLKFPAQEAGNEVV